MYEWKNSCHKKVATNGVVDKGREMYLSYNNDTATTLMIGVLLSKHTNTNCIINNLFK